jgi:hypothetical protein
VKSVTVPAEITGVKDKIGGYLMLNQVIILSSGLLLDFLIFIALPKFLTINLYKTTLMAIVFAVFGTLSIQYKGEIVLSWLLLILKYNLRPRYYIYDKNSLYLRNVSEPDFSANQKDTKTVNTKPSSYKSSISTNERLRFKSLEYNKKLSLSFKTVKGDLNVVVSEINK